MGEMSIEEIKERAILQNSRIIELQQRKIDQEPSEIHPKEPVYDLYLEDDFLYLNLDLPGALEQEIKVVIQDHEVSVSGEFPKLCDAENSEYLHRQKACGPFEYHFLLSNDHNVENHDWQLVHGVLQIRMKLDKNDNNINDD